MYTFNITLDLLVCREEAEIFAMGIGCLAQGQPTTLLLDQFLSSDPQVAENDWG